jgi:4-alpha-glucanotransferase
MTPEERRSLTELARLHGVQWSYLDQGGRRRRAGLGTMLAALRAVGARVERLGDVPGALRERRGEVARRMIEPVLPVWSGRARVGLRVPSAASGRMVVRVEEESGLERSWTFDLDGAPILAREGGKVVREVRLPDRLPLGYHRLEASVGRVRGESAVISAPPRAPASPRTWGVFLPLYALHGARSWGVGDLVDLEDLVRWVADLGGGVVATTPVCAAFLDEPFEPAPYSPASRLFWNELFIGVDRVPELDASPELRAMAASFDGELQALRSSRLVDYRRAMVLKRRMLEAMLTALLDRPSRRRDTFLGFVDAHPRLRDYARFRAAVDRHRAPWQRWPEPQRGGRITAAEVDAAAVRYHMYAQWLMGDQLAAARDVAGRDGVALSLDLPLGTHPAGYDVWREREVFATEATAGAPPDSFFGGGQDWNFPPPHPDGMRADGYRYFRDCVRHLLSPAGVLRVDHVMAFHRLYWIPKGLDARHGVYVRYRPDELYAVLLLEAHRAGAAALGEDLGTVPAAVRRAMARHHVRRSFVLQPELGGSAAPADGATATLNTHDMPTFESFRRGLDIDLRLAHGWLDLPGAAEERWRRRAAIHELERSLRRSGHLGPSHRARLVEACLAALGSSSAGVVIAALEDLWGETAPQNVPGTEGGANWRRRAGHPLERIRSMLEVTGALRSLDRARRSAEGGVRRSLPEHYTAAGR